MARLGAGDFARAASELCTASLRRCLGPPTTHPKNGLAKIHQPDFPFWTGCRQRAAPLRSCLYRPAAVSGSAGAGPPGKSPEKAWEGLVCLSAGEGTEWLPWTQRTCPRSVWGALEATRTLGRRPSSRRHTPNSRCPNTEGRAENQTKGRVHLVAVHCDHPERGGDVEDAHQGDKLFGKGPDPLASPSPKQKKSGAARQPRSASGALKAP